MKKTILLIATTTVLGGCGHTIQNAKQIEEKALQKKTADTYQSLPKTSSKGAIADSLWLDLFQDAELKSLVTLALKDSPDLQMIAARKEQAEAYAKAVGAAIYPAVGITARTGTKLGVEASGISLAYLGASWELDLWGRVRAARGAAAQTALSAAAMQESVRLSLIASLSKMVWTARVLKEQERLAIDIQTAQANHLEHVITREKIGIASRQDLANAQKSLAQAKEQTQAISKAYLDALRAVDVLVGRYPAATPLQTQLIPALPAWLSPGVPSELLERRPDIIAASARVNAALKQIDQAQAARLPRISLSAGMGVIDSRMFVMQESSTIRPGAGVSLNLPLFTGGALSAQVEQKEAELREAYAQFAKAGLAAFSEVESALSGEDLSARRLQELVVAEKEQLSILQMIEDEFRIGRNDQRQVLQQKIQVAIAQQARYQAQVELLMQRVNLYLAIGGSPL